VIETETVREAEIETDTGGRLVVGRRRYRSAVVNDDVTTTHSAMRITHTANLATSATRPSSGSTVRG